MNDNEQLTADLTSELTADYVVDARPLCQGLPFVLTDAAHPRMILKYGSDFMVLDSGAFVPACSTLGHGYYRCDTRHLSEWTFTLDGVELSLLSSDVEKGYAGSFLYTNPQTATLPQQKVMIQRQLVLSNVVSEKLVIENFHSEEVKVDLCINYQCDFADMFEVRGLNRAERGRRMRPVADAQRKHLFLAYKGLDGCLIETIINFRGLVPNSIVDGLVTFELTLPVREPLEIEISINTRTDGMLSGGDNRLHDFNTLLTDADKIFSHWRYAEASISTEHEIFNMVVDRGLRDLYILRQQTPEGPRHCCWHSLVLGDIWARQRYCRLADVALQTRSGP